MAFKGVTKMFLFLLLQTFCTLCCLAACPPPDYPEGGSYQPRSDSYLPGEKAFYTCKEGFTLLGKELRTCLPSGNWTDSTPFCDIPTKLKSPEATSDPGDEVLNVIDHSTSTCFSTGKSIRESFRVYLDNPAPVYAVRLYLPKGETRFRLDLYSHINNTSAPCSWYRRNLKENQWVTLKCMDTHLLTDYLRIWTMSSRPQGLAVCEIEAYVKDVNWCKAPPKLHIQNGHLEVSHSKASLRCANRYRTVGKSQLVCDGNKWIVHKLKCEEILCDPLNTKESILRGIWLSEESKLSIGVTSHLRCFSGFRIVGEPDVVTCTELGTWSSTTATCHQDNRPTKDSSRAYVKYRLGELLKSRAYFNSNGR